MIKRRSLAIVIAAVLLISQTPVLANPLSDQLQRHSNTFEQHRSSLSTVQEQMEELEIKIELLDSEIEALMREIEKNKESVEELEKLIKEAELEISILEKEIEREQQLLDERVRAMYIRGSGGLIEAILKSEGLSELLSSVENIKRIISYDRNLINGIREKREEVKARKEVLLSHGHELRILKSLNENKLTGLNQGVKKQNLLIEELRRREELHRSSMVQAQVVVNETLRQIEETRRQATQPELFPGTVNLSGNEVIAFAASYMGTPYVWGGTTPNPGFDCSGFTKYVYARFGVLLGRTTYDQIKNGVAVSREQLKTGDLVFFGTWKNPHHMGIYSGNNSYIHAPRTGEVVKISPMTRSDYLTARRVR